MFTNMWVECREHIWHMYFPSFPITQPGISSVGDRAPSGKCQKASWYESDVSTIAKCKFQQWHIWKTVYRSAENTPLQEATNDGFIMVHLHLSHVSKHSFPRNLDAQISLRRVMAAVTPCSREVGWGKHPQNYQNSKCYSGWFPLIVNSWELSSQVGYEELMVV